MPTVFQIQVAQMFGIFSRGKEAENLFLNLVRVSCGYGVVKRCSVCDGFCYVREAGCE